MGNCQFENGKSYQYEEDIIDAPSPNEKSKMKDKSQNETSIKFLSQTDDDGQYYLTQNEDFQKMLEMPKKMIRKPAPPFESTSYLNGKKKTNLQEYKGKYLVLFFYPNHSNKQFQDEILELSQNYQEFKKLNCELLGCSIDSYISHMNYIQKSKNEGGLGQINFPLMSDVDKKISGDYGVLLHGINEFGECLRSTFIIDGQQIVRHLAINDFAGHIKAEELLRMVKSLQEEDKEKGKLIKNVSLYDKVGREEALTSAVKIFYKKMLEDERVSKYFKTINMENQKAQLTSFLCFTLGGNKKYEGKNMKDAHQHMKLSNLEFEITVRHLESTFKELNVDSTDIQEIAKLVESLRKDITIPSIFDQLGGEKSIANTVNIFYKKMLEDNRVAKFFSSTNMSKQETMQTAFLCSVLGGPNKYTGKNMKDAHQYLKLSNTEFDVAVEHLINTLKELKIQNSTTQEIAKLIEPLRKDIVYQTVSLYDQLGGETAIAKAVNIFYKKMLADPKVEKFFKTTDMSKQEAMQTSFLCYVLGGPKKYTGKNMKEAHQSMKLTSIEFDVTVNHLINTLKEMNVGNSIIQEIGKLIEPLRKDIVNSLSLYEQIGGEKVIESAVAIFYNKILGDTNVAGFFKNTDMNKQSKMQQLFLTIVLGGPNDYKGKNMKEAHKNMNLTDKHYDITVGHLVETLKQLKVNENIIKQFGIQLENIRKDVVSISTPSTTLTDPNRRYLTERIGGESKIEELSGILIDRLYEDNAINPIFANVNKATIKDKLKSFLISLSSQQNYNGKSLIDAHAALQINDVHYNIFLNHIRECLKQMSVELAVFHQFCGLFESFRSQIVTIKLSIYERLGGEPQITIISDKLYKRILEDEKIKAFFAKVDINKMKETQKNFLIMMTGGPRKYSGKSLKEAHFGMKVNDIHFNAFKRNLLIILKELLVDPQTFNEISNLIETSRSSIVSVTLPLLDRLEGEVGVKEIVNRFYDRILLDPRVKKSFENIDMQRLRKMNHQFLLYCVKGVPSYTGKSMKDAHSNLQLNDTHFNLIKDHMIQAMKDTSKDSLSISEIANLLEGLRHDIVSVKLQLFDRIGGEQILKKGVEMFYKKSLVDPRIKEFFNNVDMNKLKSQNTCFLAMIMGGPKNYQGKSMKQAHEGMKINDRHYSVLKDHIIQSFKELGIDNITLTEIQRIVELVRNDIVSVRPPLYDRVGQDKGLEVIVGKFFDKLTKNQTIGTFFQGIDSNRLKLMLKNFFSTTFGGPKVYSGKKLIEAHSGIKITDPMFNQFKGCMEGALREMNLNPFTIKDVLQVFEHFKKEIVIN